MTYRVRLIVLTFSAILVAVSAPGCASASDCQHHNQLFSLPQPNHDFRVELQTSHRGADRHFQCAAAHLGVIH